MNASRLVAAVLLAATAATPVAFAQPAPAVEGERDQIIVTGTRRADRILTDSPVPVDVLSAESLSHTGLTETARALRDLVPSFNFPQPSITDGTDVIRPATLRGLGPDQTLVLLNGKRRHLSALLNINGSVGRGTQAVDINLIPPELRLKKKRNMRKVTAAGCALLGVLGIVGFGLKTAADLRSELSVVTQEVSELKKQVRSIEALQEEARKAEQIAAAITGIRAGDISKLKLLEELTRLIPEDSFLTEFYYKAGEKKISLTGFAASASKLVPLLEESPLFESVKFTSPITSDKRTGKERFRLEMNISSGASPSP